MKKTLDRKYVRWEDAPVWVKVGRCVRNYRKWREITPEQAALRAKIDVKRYKRIERAIVQDITIDEAYRIVDALKIYPDEIIPF